jgi:hypothetical protein
VGLRAPPPATAPAARPGKLDRNDARHRRCRKRGERRSAIGHGAGRQFGCDLLGHHAPWKPVD